MTEQPSNSEIPRNTPSLRGAALFDRILDHSTSPEEFQEFERRLQADPVLRQEYVQFVDTEACLYDELMQRPERTISPALPARTRRLWFPALLVAASAIVLLLLNVIPQPLEEPIASIPSGPISRSSDYQIAPLQGLADVAVVTAVNHPADVVHAVSVGDRLKPGVLTLSTGELQLDFVGGTRLLLKGPAELHLVSTSAATLVAGSAAVRVPYSQTGFILSAPEAAVIAAGAEFATRVLPDRKILIQSYSGTSDISLLGDDGTTLISQRINEQAIVTLDAGRREFVSRDEPASPLPRVRDLEHTDLIVTKEYVHEVEQSRPYLYWRFDEEKDGQIPDSLNGPYAAQILGDDISRETVRIANGMAEFLPSPTPRCIASVELIPDFNKQDFSVELWMLPAELKASGIFSTILPDEIPSPRHLTLIEIAFNTNLVHKPGVIRFLHRQPPALVGGYNLFTQDVCPPGSWSHIVATKSANELRLHINGQLIRAVSGPGTGASDNLSYRLVLGQLGTRNPQRQFHGMIDEVAVYRRVLPSEEILRHYRSIAPDASLAGTTFRDFSSPAFLTSTH